MLKCAPLGKLKLLKSGEKGKDTVSGVYGYTSAGKLRHIIVALQLPSAATSKDGSNAQSALPWLKRSRKYDEGNLICVIDGEEGRKDEADKDDIVNCRSDSTNYWE